MSLLQANAETSKVQILESPRLSPGTCALCGTSRTDDRKYIDIGMTVEFVGAIYFCTFCMTEIANRLGMYTVEQSKQLEDELDRARQRILEFETRDGALSDVVANLRNSGLFTDTGSSMLTISGDPATEQEPVERPQDVIRTEPKSDESNRDPEQSDSKQRPDDVPTTSIYDFDFNL